MNRRIGLLVGLTLLCGAQQALADTAWSTQDYDLYPGDFNGDGLTDMLYVSKNPSFPNGIVLSDGSGLNTPLQSWGNAYLGIPWSAGLYNIIVADFNGDGKADILLQRKTAGDNYLLLTEDGGVGAISQTIPHDQAGIEWSGDQHRIIAGDFNGDGKADLFFQSLDAKGLNAVVLADDLGQFTAAAPAQSWNDGYAGFNWALSEANVYAGDFNGDGMADLLVQAQPTSVSTGKDVQPATFAPNSNGVIVAQAAKQLFVVEQVQAWNRDGFGADWSPLDSAVVIGDFNGDGRADVILQGLTSVNTSSLLTGQLKGAIFATGTALTSKVTPTADSYRLLVGRFASGKQDGLFYQATTASGSNYLAFVHGSQLLAATQDLATPSGNSQALAAAPVAGGGAAMALQTVTSAGRTPGQFAVSAMGAATYQIPIWTPPGARGIEPKLALVYMSGGGDGAEGPGWSLSGLSSITRCGKTFVENGAPAPVTLTSTDDFCLDGNRLRVTSGTYGASGSQYQTEIANFSRVTASGTAGNGPSYFVVEGKDGLIYEYGNTADSKAYANGGTTPYAWMLNKVRDRQTQADNMTVAYSTTSGSIQPSTISYTQTPSTNGTTYPYTVSFSYQNRVTNLSRYVASGNILQTQVLNKINVQSSGVSVRQYTLTYATAPTTQRDRLASIQECGGSAGTDCLRATTVTYQDGSKGVTSPSSSAGNAAAVAGSQNTADFNGDGKLDLVYATGSGTSYTWWIQLASGTGYGAAINTGLVTSNPYNVLFDDFDGDGKEDLLGAVSGTWTVSRWNGTGFTATSTGTAVDPQIVTTKLGAASADTDGDGLPDLIWINQDPSSNIKDIMILRNTSAGGSVSFSSTASIGMEQVALDPQIVGNNGNAQSAVRHMDFNGDGRDDLLYGHTSPRQQVNIVNQLLSNGASFNNSSNYLVGDSIGAYVPVRWNDDACTDVAYTDPVYGAQGIVISACDGNPLPTTITGFPGGQTVAMDWDGDGRTDILQNVGGVWQVFRSLGTSMAAAVSTGISYGTSIWLVTDQDGDGLSDLWSVDTGNAVSLRLHNGARTPADLATTISDGWGISASPTYTPITQNNYTKYSDAVYPETDVMAPIYVISSASQSDGIGGSFTNSFWYYGARVNRQGRGFEGFYATRSQDSRNSVYSFVYYNRAYPFTGTVFEQDTLQPNGSSLIAKTVNTFNVKTLVGACTMASNSTSQCLPYLATATNTSYEITTGSPLIQTSVSSFQYDNYGNATQASTTTTDNDPASPNYNTAWSSVVANTITPDTANWCLDKPTRTTTQNTVPGQSAQTRTVDHTIDAVKCRFNSETAEPLSATLKAVTNFAYDTCGNVNSVGVIGLDQNGITMPTRTTTSSYGTRCTFPESVTNALSQSSTTTYNYSYGVKSSSTDPNGVAVSWGYDNFGRRTSESRPDSTSTLWGYADCITATCWSVTDNLRLQVTETQRDTALATVRVGHQYSDGLDRAKYSDVQRVLGTVTNTKTTYDNLGRKVDVYLPYAAASNGYHHFVYDLLNRPTSDELHNNAGATDRTTGMAYAGLKTTITDAKNSVTSKWTDVAGKLRRIIDPTPGGTTNYTFDPFGNLIMIVDAKLPTGATTSFLYNIRGFKTGSTDPDTGTWTYTPDSLNELMVQTDAKSQVTTMGYDLLGRMISRLEPESTTATSWTYGTSAAAHEIGRLKNVTKPDGYKEDYTFDSLGRPATAKYTEDVAYTVSYAYNSIGAVDTVTYPASTGTAFALKYLYSYGALQQVKDNAAGTVFWTLSAANDFSSPLTEVLGNGITVTSGYTPWTNDVIARKEGTPSILNSLQDLAYQWDKNGNLSQRQDLKQTLTEVFVNDSMNRLTTSTLNGVGNLTVSYDEAGNINNKGDVGTYDYTTAQAGCSYTGLTAQPHAVRKAGTGVYCYDKNGNMMSRQGGVLAWTSYNLPNSIAYGANSTTFNYNANHQRWKQDANYVGTHEVTYYIGGIMEKTTRGTGPTEYRHMIPAGSGTAILTRRSDLTNSTYYVTTDHLGSGDLVMDSTATVLARESFTPFGARRGSNWTGIPTSGDYSAFASTTRRGFTGHEMLDSVSLIHMNGRVYDPYLGRFLSADPIIQTLAISQAINPFSYVMNNPLSLIDPSGYSWLSKLFSGIGHFLKKWAPLILAAVLTVIGVGPLFIGLYSSLLSAAINGGTIGSFVLGIAVGAIAGAIAGPIGGKFVGFLGVGTKTLAATILRGAIVGGLAGGISSSMMGGSFLAGVGAGAIGGAVTAWAGWEHDNGGKSSAGEVERNANAKPDPNPEGLFRQELNAVKGLIHNTFFSWLRAKLFGQDEITFEHVYRFHDEVRNSDYENLTGIPNDFSDSSVAGYTRWGHSTIYMEAAYPAIYINGMGSGSFSAATSMQFTILHEYAHLSFGATEAEADAYAVAHMPSH